MRIFDAQATREALPFERLVPALHAMVLTGCEVPQRHTYALPGAPGEDNRWLVMPAWQPGGLMGIKTVAVYPGNAARGQPGLHSTYLLHDARTGAPLAMVDGDEITSRRTAAVSALAASRLAPAGARTLLVLGTGRVGRLLPEAFGVVRPIARVLLWDRKPQAAQALAVLLRAQGVDASATRDLAGAAREADIVSCATFATEPLVQGGWLAPRSHLDLVGSFTPQMREADDSCWRGARVHVDTLEALHKSGDLIGPLARGVVNASQVRTLAELLAQPAGPAEEEVPGRTVFKAVGTALADLAAASLVYRGA